MSAPTNLPVGWARVRLDEIAEVRLGRQRSPKNHAGDQMRPYLRAANVTWGGLDLTDVKEMNFTEDEVRTYQLRLGDILLSEASGSATEVGKPAIWRGEHDAPVCFQNTLLRVRPDAGVLPEYLHLRLLFECISGGFARSSRGVGIHHLGAANLSALEVELPPTEEQQRIVAALQERLPQLDGTVRDLTPLERHLERLEEAVTHAAILGRLLPGSAGATPAAVHLAAALDDVPAPDTPGLPTLPAGWTWTTLGALCDVTGGVTKDAKKQGDPSYVEVPYLRVANVQKGRLDLDEVTRIRVPQAKAEALRLLPGDVLFNEGGDRDKLGRGWVWENQIPDCIHQNHVFRGRIRGGVLDPRLLSWHGNTFGRRWFEANGKQTTNLASLSMTNLKRLPVPVPPAEDQPLIVAELQRRLSIIQAARGDLAALRNKTQALRRSLLRTAVTGQLVDQDPVEESAELLLKRIAEERTAAAPTARRRRVRTVLTAREDAGIELVEESS